MFALLAESGSYLLQEDGGSILLNQFIVDVTGVQSAGYVGSVLLWSNVLVGQDAGWPNIATQQDAIWLDVAA